MNIKSSVSWFTLHRRLIFRCRSYQTRYSWSKHLMPSGSSHSGLEIISHLLFSCKFTIAFLHWLLVFCKHLNWKQMCLCQALRCWSQAHHMDLNECRTANGSHVSHFKLNQTPLEERNICCVLLKIIECLNEPSGVSTSHVSCLCRMAFVVDFQWRSVFKLINLMKTSVLWSWCLLS